MGNPIIQGLLLGVIVLVPILIIVVPLKYFPKYRNIVWKYAGAIGLAGIVGGAIIRLTVA